MKTFEKFDDFVEVKCKKCGSSNVDLEVDNCEECGSTISSYCGDCKAEYKYHNFKLKGE